MYQPLGLEQHVNELLPHLRVLTWDSFKAKAKQFATDVLQLAKTRWTVWDPRRGEYAFQVSCRNLIIYHQEAQLLQTDPAISCQKLHKCTLSVWNEVQTCIWPS